MANTYNYGILQGGTGSFGSIQYTDDASGTTKQFMKSGSEGPILYDLTSVSASATVKGGAAEFASVTTAGAVVVGGNLTVQGTTTTVDSTTINLSRSVTFEGLADDFETTLTIVEPTADREIKLANAGGFLQPFAAASTTQISATPTELNVLDGITSNTAELNILDGVTANAAEINLVDGATAGTIVNSKAVVYGSSGEVNATTLQIGGSSISATAAEINYLDNDDLSADDIQKLADLTATADEINDLAGNAVDADDFTKLSNVSASADELNLLNDVTRGSIIHGNSSGASALLAKGAANTVLSSDGTDISYTQVSNDMLAGSITAAKMNNAIFEDLETLGAASSDGEFIVATGAGVFAYESGNTARTSLGLGTGDKPSFNEVSASVGVFAPHVRLSGSTGIIKAVDTSKNDGTYVDLVSLNDSEAMIVFDTEMGYGVRSGNGFDTGESGSLLSSNALEATNEAALRLASSTSTADNMEIDKAEAAVSVEFKSIGSGGIIFKDYDNDETIMTIVSSSAGGVAMDLKTGTIANLVDPSNDQDAATKAYVDAQLTGADLDFQGDTGGALSIDLDSEVLSIVGTDFEIETAGTGNQIKIGLPDDVTIGQHLTVSGELKPSSHIVAQASLTLKTGGNAVQLGESENKLSAVYATNVYTGDFHMKNERGDWTLFEESDYLRIRNNKTGQEFKMDMTPIKE